MQAGNVGGGDKGSGRRAPARDKMQACDLFSDSVKKAWLTLKGLHDRDLLCLQRQLSSLRRERLADGTRKGSTAKIKELMERQKILNVTIRDLRDKLSSEVCDRCSANERYIKTLQKEFYRIQQQNKQFIAVLTAERNKLKEENELLSARLKLKEQLLHPSSSDSDDFIPCPPNRKLVFSVTEPASGSLMHQPIRLVKQSNTEQMKSGGKKEQQQSSQFPIPFDSEDLLEVPDAPLESSSNSSQPVTGSSANWKSLVGPPLTSTPNAQRGHGFQGDFGLSEDSLGSTIKKPIFTQNTSTQKPGAQRYFSWSPSSISPGENPPTPLVSETSEEDMPSNTSLLPPFTQRKEKSPSHVSSSDSTSSGKRSVTVVAHYKTGFSVRDSCSQTPSNEELTVRKNTTEPTGAAYGADKPQGETKSPILQSTIKRKARVQSRRRR